MVLGKLPVPGRPATWIRVGQGPTALFCLPLSERRPDID